MRNLEVPDHVAVNFFKSQLNGTATSNVYYARCPVCGDSAKDQHRKRMYLLKEDRNWYVFCHNCAYSSSLLKFVKHFYPSHYDTMLKECIGDFFKDKKKDDEINNIIESLYQKVNKRVSRELNPVKKYIKKHCQPLKEKKELVVKLKQRRLSDSFISTLFYDKDGDYKERIIIPLYNKDNEPYYFQAMATQKWQAKYKYINWSNGNIIEKPLYNDLFVDLNKTVFIVEGLFDSLFVKNSVSTMGASLSKSKIKELKKKFPKRIWIMDNDKSGDFRSKILFEEQERCVLFPDKYKKIKDLNDLAILLKQDDLTKIAEKNVYNGLEGLIELNGRR